MFRRAIPRTFGPAIKNPDLVISTNHRSNKVSEADSKALLASEYESIPNNEDEILRKAIEASKNDIQRGIDYDDEDEDEMINQVIMKSLEDN